MRSNQRSLLAVDLTPQQMRVVEMQGRASAAQTLRAAVGPMPDGAFTGDHIADPEAVGAALRRLLESMGAQSREAVFGIVPGIVRTQVPPIPPVPASELAKVLENELEHLKVIRPGEGVFDYAPLAGPAAPANGADAGETQILVMAADRVDVDKYRQAALAAGVKMLALEPTLLAMYRVGAILAREQPGLVCISLNYNRCEMALSEQGEIRLYRRIDIGADALFPSHLAGVEDGGAGRSRPSILGEDPDADEPAMFRGMPMTPDLSPALNVDGTPAVPMSVPIARSLAQELRRSLEYYRRENPNANPVTQAVLISDSPDIAPFAPWLMQMLELDVRLARPSEVSELGQVPPAYITAPNAAASGYGELALLPALGLGLGMLPDHPLNVPHFDLAGEQTANAALETARAHMTLALAAALVIMLIGIGATLVYGNRANEVAHEVGHLQEELKEKQLTEQVIINRIQAQQAELTTLQKRGFPFPRMMDAITGVLAPQTALTEVDLDKTGKLTVMGNAFENRAIDSTLDGMRTISWFEIPTLDSFDRKAPTQTTPGYVSFKILTQLANMRPVTAATTTTGATSGTTTGGAK